MSAFQERYSPIVIPVDGTVLLTGSAVGGFLCKTAGAITITENTELGGTLIIVNAHPVTAGLWLPIPFHIGPNGGTVTLSLGASGTLGV